MSKKKKKTLFNHEWPEDNEFKSWLASTKDEDKARCKLCKKNIELSHMGRQALLGRCSGKKHKEIDIKVKTFFSKPEKTDLKENKKESDSSEPTIESNKDKNDSLPKIQQTIEIVIQNAENSKAEIKWALKSISAGYSNNSCYDIANLFRDIFPCQNSKLFQLGPKLKYITNFGIASYFKSVLLERIKESSCYVISYDESLNKKTQSSEMDLLVRYFDKTEERVKTSNLDSQFLGHGTSIDLKRNFDETVKDLNPNKLIQIGMDDPNVNLKLLKTIQTERSENEQHQVIDLGSCGLHTIHNSFKTGAQSTDWELKKTLKGSYQVFHDTHARREDFVTVTNTDRYPLSFGDTRFASLVFVIDDSI